MYSYFYRINRTFNIFFFFFNDTATTEIYTLSLHDALPICTTLCSKCCATHATLVPSASDGPRPASILMADRKSTRLNSSHSQISYAVFCLKKKKKEKRDAKYRYVGY